jgi:hypothetical protein
VPSARIGKKLPRDKLPIVIEDAIDLFLSRMRLPSRLAQRTDANDTDDEPGIVIKTRHATERSRLAPYAECASILVGP